jgi:hypothetical protein
MKNPCRLSFGALSLVSIASITAGACATTPSVPESHWNIDSVPQSVVKHMTGYRGELDGNYRDFQWRKKKDINLTLRRHFLNNNPENPFEPPDPSRTELRAPYSVLPDPLLYFHVEALAVGAVTLAWTGAFIPIPIDSVIATFSEGGWSEFGTGIKQTFTGEWEGRVGDPAPPSKFRVRHR